MPLLLPALPLITPLPCQLMPSIIYSHLLVDADDLTFVYPPAAAAAASRHAVSTPLHMPPFTPRSDGL